MALISVSMWQPSHFEQYKDTLHTEATKGHGQWPIQPSISSSSTSRCYSPENSPSCKNKASCPCPHLLCVCVCT